MVLRKIADGVVGISQPAHAWLAGQLALRWGNAAFGKVTPRDDVLCAAALHDIGFLSWEQAPTLNRQTGLPHDFVQLPVMPHLAVWTRGIRQMQRYGRYASLLVSLHFSELCKKHPASGKHDIGLQRKFLRRQEELQSVLVTSLLNDFYYAPFTEPDIIERNARLVGIWDYLSLLLCMGLSQPKVIESVPAARKPAQITLLPDDDKPSRFRLHPWPFNSSKPIELTCEGKKLLKTFQRQSDMRAALKAASPVTLRFELCPG